MIANAATAATTGGLWDPALAVGVLTAGVALFTLAVNQIHARKDRQRELFEDAFATVTDYREYPFIVRRRHGDGADRQKITADLSAVQARLNQFIARLRVEAPRVGRVYQQLVADTRRVAGAEIARSWDLDPIPTHGPMHVRDIDLTKLAASDEAFLQEVGDQLAAFPGRLRRVSRAASGWLWPTRSPRQEDSLAPGIEGRQARQ